MATKPEFASRPPKPNRAKRLAKEALALAREGKFLEAVPLVEQALRLDQLNALSQYCALRAEICAAAGDDKPSLAITFYDHAIQCKRKGRYRDAKVAYLEAHALDPVFLWPANNYAWLLATSTEPNVRDGKEALKYALWLCKRSRFNCWAFLGTLAAAYAEAGDFALAIGWQTSALELAPAGNKIDALIQLRHYQAGRAYIDEGLPVAAGDEGELYQARPAGLLSGNSPPTHDGRTGERGRSGSAERPTAEAQPNLVVSDYPRRLLIALHCEHNTSACVKDMLRTPEMDTLYREFIQLTRSSLTRDEVARQLEELERVEELGAVSDCLKCKQLRCNVRAYLCPRCTDAVRGVQRSYLPPLVKPGSRGCGGAQVNWHPSRDDEPSPWQEYAIRNWPSRKWAFHRMEAVPTLEV